MRRPPVILTQPTNQYPRPGSNALFTVNATGSGFLRYQWQFNGADIPGATRSTYLVTNAQFINEGLYGVTVTDNVTSIRSVDGRLLIAIEPVIVQQPLSQTIVAGGTVTLSLVVTNTATLPVGYRLRRNSVTLNETFLSLNQRSVFYTITNLLASHTNYQIIVTNVARPGGSLSASAFLTILADTDGDGIPDAWESEYGFNPTNATDRTIDSDGDGMLNWGEFVAGTNPTNASSYLKVELAGMSGGATVRFNALSNKTYTVEYNNSLDASSWIKLTDLPARATNRTELLIDSAGTAQRHYRLITPRRQ